MNLPFCYTKLATYGFNNRLMMEKSRIFRKMGCHELVADKSATSSKRLELIVSSLSATSRASRRQTRDVVSLSRV
jgi:hypothetical protein